MRRGLGTKLAVVGITALLAVYLFLTVRQSWLLVTGGDAVAVGLGLALIVLPVLAVVFIGRELVFGMQAQRLLHRMIDEEALPEGDLPRTPDGRVVREAADADFDRWKQDVERTPDDWRAWYRLGMAYRASRDGGRARAAVRKAIELERAERRGAA